MTELTVVLSASVTLTDTEKVPVALGVPEMVSPLSAKPAGSPVADHV